MSKDERYLDELVTSLCPEVQPLSRKPKVQIVWPTVDCIRLSAQVLFIAICTQRLNL